MKKYLFLLIVLFLSTIKLSAQNIGINATGTSPDKSAMLDVSSTTKGMLVPRMTTAQRTVIASPAKGLLVFDTNNNSFWFYNGTAWADLSGTASGSLWLANGNNINNSNTNNVGIGIGAPLAKLHIKGSADTSQLVIDASSTQSNNHPLMRFRNAAGIDLIHIHSDNINNTFFGLNSGKFNDAAGGAVGNTFIGSNAGSSNTTGYSLTAFGWGALTNNNTGAENTAIGTSTLYYNISGSYNTAMGRGALFQNQNSNNTATGFKALFSNIGGRFNTANGSLALVTNINGNENTAVGYEALLSNTASRNSAFGTYSLLKNESGARSCAFGTEALNQNITGNQNTAIGDQSLLNTSTGNDNTAVGWVALFLNKTGSGNTALGSGANVSYGNLTNATAIGYSAYVDASNKVRIGNSEVTVIEGQVAYSYPSDARFKYNIKSNVPGLDFIKRLTPVTYYFDERKLDVFTKSGVINNNISISASFNDRKELHSGFLAQDVEKIASELGYEFDGVHAPTNDRGHYSLSYSQFIMPLVKAVQEQQTIINNLYEKVELLVKRLNALEGKQ